MSQVDGGCVCDAGDWFRPELGRIILEELQEPPRFHRKQWEFAVIYRALEAAGLLDGTREGISFGSGTERLLYALARRVKHLWATDLYAEDSAWDIARTERPLAFLEAHAPFPIPPGSVSARAMDMRTIAFPPASFDFAYSSCAIEHIGHRADFVRHLKEVRRVLRPGGVYAFTTELTWQREAVALEGNYYFSRALLEDVVRESGLACAATFDATLSPHAINTPLPIELSGGRNDGEGRFNERLFGLLSHLQLCTANVPFTSCLVVLRKEQTPFEGFTWRGWEESQRQVEAGLGQVRALVEEAELELQPFAWLPDRRSRQYLGHAAFFAREPAPPPDRVPGAMLHTAYVWLGARPRELRVSLGLLAPEGARVHLTVHRSPAARPDVIEVEQERWLPVVGGALEAGVALTPRDGCTYAVLASIDEPAARLTRARVTASPAGAEPLVPLAAASPPGPAVEAGGPPLLGTAVETLSLAARALPRVALSRLRRLRAGRPA